MEYLSHLLEGALILAFMAVGAITAVWNFVAGHVELILLFFVVTTGAGIIHNQQIIDRKVDLLARKIDLLAER